jgi:hypothetical protein
MSCQELDPLFFADGSGTIMPCYKCGILVKFMHDHLDMFHKHGRVCAKCEKQIKEAIPEGHEET